MRICLKDWWWVNVPIRSWLRIVKKMNDSLRDPRERERKQNRETIWMCLYDLTGVILSSHFFKDLGQLILCHVFTVVTNVLRILTEHHAIKSVLYIKGNKINQPRAMHQQICLSGPFQSPHHFLGLNFSLPYSLLLPLYSIYVGVK